VNVALRAATAEDCERTWRWANDPETRAASFNSAPIERADHERWFSSSLGSPVRALWIAELDGSSIGILRLDRCAPERAEIGVTVAPERRGQGLALPLLQAGVHRARSLGLEQLVARIRPTNERSLRSFVRAGFRAAGREVVAGQDALRYELRLDCGT
jgi:RimJ/RimL family protein N-acetyltransferase